MALSSSQLENLLFVLPLGRAKKAQFPHPDEVGPLLKGGFLSQEPRSWFYDITVSGKFAARGETPVASVAPVVEKAKPAPALPVGFLSVPELQDDPLYAADAYLRSVAVQHVECWGAHTDGDAQCGACPLAASCRTQARTRVMTSLRNLEVKLREDAEKKLAEEAKARQEAETKARMEAAAQKEKERSVIDDILGSATPAPMPVTPNPVPAPAPAPTVTAAPPSFGMSPNPSVAYKEIVVPFTGICSGCKGKINVGEIARWATGRGMFHPTCLGGV